VYDTAPLASTLEQLVDFDFISRGSVRLSLGAVNVCKGCSVYFDSETTAIQPDHVRASGALPPGFPPVTIAGEHYWDGGVVTNTPITYVADQRPKGTARIIQVDNFNAEGELPRNLGLVTERAKDIQYASRTRFNIDRLQEISEVGAAVRRLLDKLPAELQSDPDAQKLASVSEERNWTIIRLINKRPSRSGAVKDYEFSRATIEEAWAAGLEDVRRSVADWDDFGRRQVGGIRVYRPTEERLSPGWAPGERDRLQTANP
jgi:NTE family protein